MNTVAVRTGLIGESFESRSMSRGESNKVYYRALGRIPLATG
jgi:hypothetical protein